MILTPQQIQQEKKIEHQAEIDRLSKIINDYLRTKEPPIEIDVTEYSQYAIDQIRLECIKSFWKIDIKTKQDTLHGRPAEISTIFVIEDRVIPVGYINRE